MIHSQVAAMLGRADLSQAQTPSFMAFDPYDYTGQLVNSATSGTPANTGRISAAMLAAIVIGLAAFYYWTREVQK